MKRRSRWLLLSTVPVLIVVWVCANWQPAGVSATIRVTPPPAEQLPAAYTPYDRRRDFEAFKDLVAWTLTDPAVVNRTLADMKVVDLVVHRERPDQWLTRHLEAEYVSDELLTVRLRVGPEQEAETLLNAHLNAFQEHVNEQLHRDQQERLQALRTASDDAQVELARVRRRVGEFDQQLDAASEVSTMPAVAAERHALNREVEQWERRIAEIEDRRFWLEYAIASHPPQVTVVRSAEPVLEDWPDRIRRWLGM